MKPIARLNNRKMRAIRSDIMYEAIMTDLYLIGGVERAVAEALIGHKISDFVSLPAEVKAAIEEDDRSSAK